MKKDEEEGIGHGFDTTGPVDAGSRKAHDKPSRRVLRANWTGHHGNRSSGEPMIRSALAFCATMTLALCFACAPVPPAPPPAPAPIGPQVEAKCSDGSKFLDRVWYLQSAFQPGRGKTVPTGTTLPDDPYGNDLTQAFNAAPDAFKKQLCALDAIYVQGTACTSTEQCFDESWGWWQTTKKLKNGRIVGLSAALWKYKAGSPPVTGQGPYSWYESDVMKTVVAINDAYYSGAASCAATSGCNCEASGNSCTTVDTFPVALVAALAHEVGHILWYDTAQTYDSGTDTFSPPHNFCSDGTDFFLGWRNKLQPKRWRPLSTPQTRAADGWRDIHANPPYLVWIDQSTTGPFRALRTAQLIGTNQSWALPPPNPPQPWASVFGAVSPDEDFVETYKFKVLTSAPISLKWVKITIPSYILGREPYYANVADDYVNGLKSDLAAKLRCMPDSFPNRPTGQHR